MIETMLAAGLLFWGIVVVLTILLFVFIEYNQGGWATISLLAVLGILQWWAKVDIIGAVRQEPLLAVAGVAAGFEIHDRGQHLPGHTRFAGDGGQQVEPRFGAFEHVRRG